jgi:hypothetical protein
MSSTSENVSDQSKSNSSTCSKTKSTSRRLYSFDEARKIARGHGFSTKQEFLDYECAGAYQIPKDADVVWKDDWRGWDDFLGIPLSFEEVSLKVNKCSMHDSYQFWLLLYVEGTPSCSCTCRY